MTLKQDQTKIIATCSEIYKNEPKEESLLDNRRQVLNMMRRNAAKSFKDGKTLINNLFQVEADQITQLTHRETITDFQNLVDPISPNLAHKLQLSSDFDLRQAHAALIHQQLTTEINYVFLTGNPGIGKTSAIAQFLQQPHILEDCFLFFYVSPRKQVNLDILEKFTNPETQKLCDDRIFTINTNADIIRSNQGNYSATGKITGFGGNCFT